MVVQYYLGIMWRIDFGTRYILVLLNIRVDIDDFTVSFISKQKPRLSAP